MRRGLSLLETMIALAMLALMTLATISLYRSGLASSRKTDSYSSSYRACLIALEHVRSELRGSQLLSPGTGPPENDATYRFPRVRDGLPVVDDEGLPQWAGRATLLLRPDGKFVRREDGVGDRVLADLGPTGVATFERLDSNLLRVVLEARREDEDDRKSSHYRLTADVPLPNN